MKRSIKNFLWMLPVAALFLSLSAAVSASSLTNDSIRQKEENIQKAQDEKKTLMKGLSDVKKLMAQIEELKKDVASYVVKLDGQLNTVLAEIEKTLEMIKNKEAQIEETGKQLDAAILREETQYEAMKKRIQFMYERGSSFYLDVILSAGSFGDILNKAEYVEQLSRYDRQQLLEYEETRRQIAEYKASLEEERAALAEAEAVLEEEQEAVQTLIVSKEQEIQRYESDISSKEQAIKEYEEEIAAQTAQIEELERQVAEEKKRLAASSRIVYDGGKFKWPAPAYTRISDDYGNRMHPTLNVQQFHNGIDMAAPGGSPILAAYDGEVVAAAYSPTMGNYIMVDHGGGLYTIYMHASALYVSKDDIVVRGEKIAAVGTTGRSTGNHLHFTVRLNGSYVSPWNYLSE